MNADQTNSKLLKQEYGRFITFYSYKGGVGRSMALANIGVLLAQWGYDVLMIDWDLEAPGLENYFKSHLKIEQVQLNKGLIDLLSLRSASELDIESKEWQSYMKSVDLEAYLTPLPLHTLGNLSLLTAGCRDQNYEQKVRQFDYSEFYNEKGGSRFIEDLREIWQKKYDFILIDSRTGFTASSRICTVHLPDIMLLMFTPNQQSFNGIKRVAADAVRDQEAEVLYTRFRLRTIPVPCRIENAETTLQDRWMKKIADESGPMLQWLPRDPDRDSEFVIKPEQLVNHIKIPYRTYLAYDEMLTVLERGTVDPVDLGYVYETLAAILANDLKRIQLLNGSRDNLIKRAKGELLEDLQELEESHKLLVRQINLQSEEKQKSEKENIDLKKRARRVTYVTVTLLLTLISVIAFFVWSDKPSVAPEQVKYDLFMKAVKDTSSNYDKYSEVNIVSLYKSYYTLDSAYRAKATYYKSIMDNKMAMILTGKVAGLGDLLHQKSTKEAAAYFSKRVQFDELSGVTPEALLSDSLYGQQLRAIVPNDFLNSAAYRFELSSDSVKFVLKYVFTQLKSPTPDKDIKVNLSFNYDLKLIALQQLDPASWERKAFDYLLHKKVDMAIACFDNSDLSEANYHNAFEISNILQLNRRALEDSASSQWPVVYRHIVDSCSWKMPSGVAKKLKILGKASEGSLN